MTEPKYTRLILEALPSPSCPPPDAAFIEDVKMRGIIDPITLAEIDDQLVVISGRRRLFAARSAELETVPVIIHYDLTEEQVAEWILKDNILRSDNPLADLQNIELLIKKGYTKAQIAANTGMTQQTIDKRLRLSVLKERLCPSCRGDAKKSLQCYTCRGKGTQPTNVFFFAIYDGKLALSAAERIAKMKPEYREKLAVILDDGGKVNGRVIREITSVATQLSSIALPRIQEPNQQNKPQIISCLVIDNGTPKVFTELSEAFAYAQKNSAELYRLIPVKH